MIRISRNSQDGRGRTISPNTEWFKRSDSARLQAIKKVGTAGYGFDASVYGADSVRASLSRLFLDKCAYCEYPLTRTDTNVEHYRPKARVAEAPTHPGYYWLAYDWSNLLPTCTFCNQTRKELSAWPDTTRAPSAGKADSFPLEDESRRAYSPSAELSDEEPLLVNPTVEEPRLHISFDPFGMPIPRTQKGKVSIAVYNLDTRQLNRQRRCVIEYVTDLLKLRKKVEGMAELSEAPEFLTCIDAQIRKTTSCSANYAAAARAVIDDPSAFGL